MPVYPGAQWVLSVPYRLRFRLAYAPRLASAVLRVFIAALTSDLRRRARRREIRGRLQAGSLTVVQRFGSALGLNVHFHSLVLDGVHARRPDGSLLFHPLPAPTDQDVARVARAVSRKVSRVLARQRPPAEEQPSLLDELANASVQGLVATGPRRGCHALRLSTGGDAAEASITGRRCADVAGFNVHANVRVHANDRDSRENLCSFFATCVRSSPP